MFYNFVMVGRKGLIRSGASVCPRKILAAAFIDSAAVVPTVTYRSQPIKYNFSASHAND